MPRCSTKSLWAQDSRGVWHKVKKGSGLRAYTYDADGQVVRLHGSAMAERLAGSKDGSLTILIAAAPPTLEVLRTQGVPHTVRHLYGTPKIRRQASAANGSARQLQMSQDSNEAGQGGSQTAASYRSIKALRDNLSMRKVSADEDRETAAGLRVLLEAPVGVFPRLRNAFVGSHLFASRHIPTLATTLVGQGRIKQVAIFANPEFIEGLIWPESHVRQRNEVESARAHEAFQEAKARGEIPTGAAYKPPEEDRYLPRSDPEAEAAFNARKAAGELPPDATYQPPLVRIPLGQAADVVLHEVLHNVLGDTAADTSWMDQQTLQDWTLATECAVNAAVLSQRDRTDLEKEAVAWVLDDHEAGTVKPTGIIPQLVWEQLDADARMAGEAAQPIGSLTTAREWLSEIQRVRALRETAKKDEPGGGRAGDTEGTPESVSGAGGDGPGHGQGGTAGAPGSGEPCASASHGHRHQTCPACGSSEQDRKDEGAGCLACADGGPEGLDSEAVDRAVGELVGKARQAQNGADGSSAGLEELEGLVKLDDTEEGRRRWGRTGAYLALGRQPSKRAVAIERAIENVAASIFDRDSLQPGVDENQLFRIRDDEIVFGAVIDDVVPPPGRVKVGVYCDVSGSNADWFLRHSDEVFGDVDHADVTLSVFDTEVRRAERATDVIGGGGTDFAPVMQDVASADGEHDSEYDRIVIVSDGMAPEVDPADYGLDAEKFIWIIPNSARWPEKYGMQVESYDEGVVG